MIDIRKRREVLMSAEINKNMKIIVTGGAGFIGSCVAGMLNKHGVESIVIVDNIGTTEKWKNVRNKKYREYVNKQIFLEKLCNGEYCEADVIIHMGACSSTTQADFDYLWQNNVEYTKTLWRYCAEHEIRFIYASSAATYGNGENGFSDDINKVKELLPLNAYGYSKQVFDQWSLKEKKKPTQYVGLKFFNVYGPNEYCKGNMASMVFHGYRQIKETGKIQLFQSNNSRYKDEAQERDFVYVKDVCKVIAYFLKHPQYNGIFNVGTGKASTFEQLATSVFLAEKRDTKIEYIPMPDKLKKNYQYHTKAEIESLRNIGYHEKFMDIFEGVEDYVENYLSKDYAIY